MAFTLSQAKSLCTASELTLVKASTRNEIGKFTLARIRQKVDRARKLRDKWRDQSRGQRRATQSAQRSRQTDAAARSAKKADLFGEVLTRFEAQLTKLEAAGKKGRPAPKRLPKRARSAAHRAGRADIRAELKEERAAMGGRKKPRPPKPKNPAEPLVPPITIDEAFGTAEGATKAERPARPTVPATKAAKGRRAHGGLGMTALESAREIQGLHVSKGKQIRAAAAAKQERLREGGKKRIQMHASARTRRRQGKRDAR